MEDVPSFIADSNGTDYGREANGRFAHGNPGRQPGTTRNKFREEIKTFLRDKWPEFSDWFNELKPSEKVKAYMELLPFGVSKLQTIAIEETEETRNEKMDLSKLTDEDLDILEALQNKMRT